MVRNLKFTVRYDGTEFQGWQTQPGFRTVQTTFEAAVAAITQEPRIRANASGRTDAGVHALGQVVNLYSTTALPCDVLVKAVNAKLPPDVAVLDCVAVGQAFDANKDAVAKRYRYQIDDARVPDPFLRRYTWQPRRGLDVAAMHAAAQALKGRHDFRSFETNYPNRLTSVRTIADISVERVAGVIRLEVEADGFLYNMVRAITGTLYQVGRGYWPGAKVGEVLRSLARAEAGMTAPPQGLFMVRVTY